MSGRGSGGGPRHVLERLKEKLESNDKEGLADLFATDCVVEWPFTPSGVPIRIEGPEAMREFIRRSPAAARLRYERVDNVVYDTADPEVLVVQTEVAGTDIQTDTPFRLRGIAVMRTRHGEIVFYRDYVDPLALARATGTLAQLAGGTSN